MPPSLDAAIATEPLLLHLWLFLLGAVFMATLLFVVGRDQGRWLVRLEPVAIVGSGVAAWIMMNWLYSQVGYVRLLGLAHLVCWTPAYVWIARRRLSIGTASLFGKYIVVYLVIVGISPGCRRVSISFDISSATASC